MNQNSIHRPLFIRLVVLTSCFVGGITSAPVDGEIGKEDDIPKETNTTDPRALSIPFLPSKEETSGKDKPSGIAGLSGLPGLPGLTDISSATAGSQIFFGAILPLPKLNDILEMFGKLGSLAGNFPTLPGLPNLPSIGGTPDKT